MFHVFLFVESQKLSMFGRYMWRKRNVSWIVTTAFHFQILLCSRPSYLVYLISLRSTLCSPNSEISVEPRMKPNYNPHIKQPNHKHHHHPYPPPPLSIDPSYLFSSQSKQCQGFSPTHQWLLWQPCPRTSTHQFAMNSLLSASVELSLNPPSLLLPLLQIMLG
jgi:hypothetical protein